MYRSIGIVFVSLLILVALCGCNKVKTGQKELIEQIIDKDPDIRRLAIKGLVSGQNIKWQELPSVLEKISVQDPSPLVRYEAIKGIVLINDHILLERVLSKTFNDKSPMVRSYVAELLILIEDKRAVDILAEMLKKDLEAKVRIMAARSLGCINTQRSARILLIGLQDEEFSVNYTSRKSLVKLTGVDHAYDRQLWQKQLTENPVKEDK